MNHLKDGDTCSFLEVILSIKGPLLYINFTMSPLPHPLSPHPPKTVKGHDL